jgi:UDP-N-acetylmuramate dehydrogenase
MKVTAGPSLKGLNSFGLSAKANILIEIESEEDVLALPGFNPDMDLVLGGGSNVVLLTDIPGNVLLNRIRGINRVTENSDSVTVEVGAGENWHETVLWSLDQGLSGLENLSLIPGNAGAAPIQNIGAYGVELASVLESVTAWDWKAACWVTLSRDECQLSYRDSLFKSGDPDRYLITSLRLALSRTFVPQIDYAGLREEIEGAELKTEMTARDVSDAVVRLRTRKLPDPGATGNVGSFFKNPVLDRETAESIMTRHHGLPNWPQAEGRIKLSAAWMIQACGLKGLREGGARVSEQHALVLVNEGGASGHDITALTIEIQKSVFETFGVRLEPEPRLVEFSLG